MEYIVTSKHTDIAFWQHVKNFVEGKYQDRDVFGMTDWQRTAF